MLVFIYQGSDHSSDMCSNLSNVGQRSRSRLHQQNVLYQQNSESRGTDIQNKYKDPSSQGAVQ